MRKRHHTLLMALGVFIGAPLLPSAGSAADAVDRLAADPDQLRQIEKQCQSGWAATGDTLCAAASKARRERFLRRRPSNDPTSTPRTTRSRNIEIADPKPSPAAGAAD